MLSPWPSEGKAGSINTQPLVRPFPHYGGMPGIMQRQRFQMVCGLVWFCSKDTLALFHSEVNVCLFHSERKETREVVLSRRATNRAGPRAAPPAGAPTTTWRSLRRPLISETATRGPTLQLNRCSLLLRGPLPPIPRPQPCGEGHAGRVGCQRGIPVTPALHPTDPAGLSQPPCPRREGFGSCRKSRADAQRSKRPC